MKSRRILTMLLSLAIMLTFMPTMAFAAAPANINGHTWTKDASKSIEPTCQHDGLYVYSCPGEDLGTTAAGDKMVLECEATSAEYKEMLKECTPKANPIQISKADYLVRLATERGYTEEQIKELAGSNNKCYLFVKECKDCGRVIPDTADWQNHKKPDGTADCAISFVCEFCGQTVYTGKHSGAEGEQYITSEGHNYDRKLIGENWCSDADAPNNGYNVYEYTCKNCGDTFRTFEGMNDWSWGPWSGTYATGVKHEKLNKIVYRPATCTEDGEYAEECEVCGAIVLHRTNGVVDKDWVMPKTGHSFDTITVPATCTGRGYTIETCKVCGATHHKAYAGDPLGHDYKVEVVFEPNCDAKGITMISCTRCDAVSKAGSGFADGALANKDIKYVDKEGYVTNSPAKDGKMYFVGLDDEFVDKYGKVTSGAIEVADWAMKAHNYGQYETLREADCIHGGYQAKKCKVCGHYDVHTAKQVGDPVGHQWTTITQDPTCGSKGWTVEVCKVCKEQNGPIKYFGKPVVAYGEKCDFSKWVVEKAATPFEEGTKKLVCRNCEDDGHLSIVRGEVKQLGVTRASIAKTKIAAPKVKAGKKKATVTVKAVEGAVKYQIKVNGKVKKTVTSAKKVTIKKLKGGKKAKFQIVAFNAEGVKAASKVKSVKIKK